MNKFLEKIVKAWENKDLVVFGVRLADSKRELIEANATVNVVDVDYDKNGKKIYIISVNDWDSKIYMYEDEKVEWDSKKDIYTVDCGNGAFMDFLFA